MTQRRPVPTALPPLSLSLLLLLLLSSSFFAPASARRGMGGGTGDDEEEDLGTMSGSSMQGRMRSSLTRVHWRIDPLSSSDVRLAEGISPDLADHVVDILGRNGQPLHVRLRDRPVAAAGTTAKKAGGGGPAMYAPTPGGGPTGGVPLRAVGSIGRLASLGRRVRTSWTSGPPSRPRDFRDEDLLRERYEEAQLHNYNRVEIEVTLPRVKSSALSSSSAGGARGGLPEVVYTFPVGEGEVNPQGFVTAGLGVVRVYPEGRKKSTSSRGRRVDEGEEDKGIEVGRIAMHASAPPGLVDPTWAKGRKFFWKGRPAGKM